VSGIPLPLDVGVCQKLKDTAQTDYTTFFETILLTKNATLTY